MSEIDVVMIAGGAVIGGGVTIGGRIIFDWLKTHGDVSAPPAAINNSNGRFSAKKCENKHREISQWQGKTDQCLTQHKAMIESHEKRLDKGSKDFEEIKKDIAGLNTSYAVLATKIK